MTDHLADGVVVEILTRLPVKSLVRFRCVCKKWCSLVSSNTFISNYHRNTSSHLFRYQITYCSYLVRIRHNEHFSLRSDDESFGHNDNFIQFMISQVNGVTLDISFRMVGSCNGVICLWNYGLHQYSLWNPSIHRIVKLPKPKISLSSSWTPNLWEGFGYDPSSNDIKLVRLVDPEGSDNTVPPLVEICTVNTGRWKVIAAPVLSYVFIDSCFSAFVNGASHWVARTSPDHEGTFHNVIVAFDMGGEVFREIPVPNSLVRERVLSMTVAVCRGLLSLVPYNRGSEEESSSVWTMKEYGVEESWTKLFSINISQGLKRVVAFRKNGEVLDF